MEGRLQISESSPLLDVDYDYGIVKHPFPLNCFMRNWYLGPDFYHAVKIGIVQYVCICMMGDPCLLFSFLFYLFWSIMWFPNSRWSLSLFVLSWQYSWNFWESMEKESLHGNMGMNLFHCFFWVLHYGILRNKTDPCIFHQCLVNYHA